jgi:Zn-finger nucleic acid-binding protein
MKDALTCPHCASKLQPKKYGDRVAWTCPACSGLAFNLAVLRDEIDDAVVAQFWRQARSAAVAAARCPSCRRAMRLIEHRTARVSLDADICVPCQLIWLDGGELDLIQEAAPRRAPSRVVRPSVPLPERVSSPIEIDRRSDGRGVLERIISIIFTSFS